MSIATSPRTLVAREVFADTAFFVALLDPRDSLNEEAIALAERLARDGARMVTTDAILLETANYCARGPLRKHAGRWIAELRADPGWNIIPLDRPVLLRAEGRYVKHADKSWSLTDCHTMEAMRLRRTRDIATTDRGFSQAGFRCLLRPS
jgi:predicted nucleic acid-binding protein